MEEIQLDKRLNALLELTPHCRWAADVGCDHGYLAAAALLQGKADRVYATDLHPLPLQRAWETFTRYHLLDRVVLQQADGLEHTPFFVQTVWIAGMGGETIRDILQNAAWTKDEDKLFLLQPMSKAEVLRKALCLDGFSIEQETRVLESPFCYTILQVRYSGCKRELTPFEAVRGESRFLPGDRLYLHKQLAKYRTIQNARKSAKVQGAYDWEIQEIIAGIERWMEEYEQTDCC